MDLRRLVLITLSFAIASTARSGPVKHWPLDDRATYPVRLGIDAPTTIRFPGSLTALEGANVSARVEDNPPVLLSHQPGANFFSVRALRPDATGALNVVYQGKLFALTFSTGVEPDRVIAFKESKSSDGTTPSRRTGPAHWLSLLDRAKRYADLAAQYPALASGIERIGPGTVTEANGLKVITEEVLRFEADVALVFRLRLENPGRNFTRYAHTQLAVRVGSQSFPAALAEAEGSVAPQSAVVVWLVVAEASDGAPAELSLKNTFSVVVPTMP